ncbi:IPT/TIG domain-containing protein [Acidicapsa acidisoli]|uniref:IPT/TIG domain-containing protein n=1 Tax=Acidicapsa acidisoli TaxID=1615681 RepID=UPI0021DF9F54|nr:IPT/TIG domain-containing protein [Acidicapsa acidisoli]
MFPRLFPSPWLFSCLLIGASVAFFFAPSAALAGGPKYVAGVSYFNPAVMGQPVIWPGGQVKYFVDQGPLGPVSNAQAVAMVDAAAAIWSAVPTAAVNLTDSGSLAEDVNGSNVFAGNGFLYAPADVAPTATSTPVAVIFDSDGSVMDALEGAGASEPDNCSMNSLLVWIDNMSVNANLAHGVILLNGRCATSANLLAMMSYQLERAFGRILGLDFSQVNPNAQTLGSTEPNGILGWPVMEPLNGECSAFGGDCIPNPSELRLDDIAALNRLYPVTAANLASFPGKMLTAPNTVSIEGTINFRSGQGMQGVNVVARPLDANGNPLYQYTVTFVSGSYFSGNRGNPVTGWTDANGNRLDRFGSNDPSLEGFFDLSAMPLPPGMTTANYQVTFEAVSPLYIDSVSVGPYLLGSPTPSGTMPTLEVTGLVAGSSRTLTLNIADSAAELAPQTTVTALPRPRPLAYSEFANAPEAASANRLPVNPVKLIGSIGSIGPTAPTLPAAIGTEASPELLPPTGIWISRIGQVGQGDWFLLPVQANRTFTFIAQALDETGTPSAVKAMPAIGVWDGFDPIGTAAAGSAPAADGVAPGETWMQASTTASDIVRLAIVDQRGDGRPDYLYRGWVLYADTVSPTHLPSSGGTIVIRGTGFRQGDTVQIGSTAAQVISVLPTEITAVVPAAGPGVTGSQNVTVNDLPSFNATAIIPGGVSYDSATGDALTLLTAPSNQVPINVPQPFSVIATDADGNPAGGVTVLYSVTSGVAALGCGTSICSVTTSGDGRATLSVTATSTSMAVVTAALTNGAGIQTHFYGGTPPSLSALTQPFIWQQAQLFNGRYKCWC